MKVAFLVNGGPTSIMGERASSFARRLGGRYEIVTAYRAANRVRAIGAFLRFLRRERPDVVYVFDMAYSGVIAAAVFTMLTRARFVLDTGDAVYELARSAGLRGPVGLAMTWLLDRIGFRLADRVVVRGTFHRTLLAKRGIEATVIPDGIDSTTFASPDASALRTRLGLDGVLSVGILGSLVWSERLRIVYGWDLVEALHLLRDEPIRGVIIGSGSGLPFLQQRAAEYELGDRLMFVDRIPFADVPAHLAAVDVWLSTQTNDIPGNVRTTGKLPLYMAAGRYILASDVGEAAIVLPPEMRVEYHGVVDREYPGRLADRLRALAADRSRLAAGAANAEMARRVFDYDVLAARVASVLDSLER